MVAYKHHQSMALPLTSATPASKSAAQIVTAGNNVNNAHTLLSKRQQQVSASSSPGQAKSAAKGEPAADDERKGRKSQLARVALAVSLSAPSTKHGFGKNTRRQTIAMRAGEDGPADTDITEGPPGSIMAHFSFDM